jgi:phosphoribosylformylglycinamidine cyclo-ligase
VEMFANYNMGAGYAIYTPQSKVKEIVAVAADQGLIAWQAGDVEAGPKQVIIEPKGLVFSGNSLGVRR